MRICSWVLRVRAAAWRGLRPKVAATATTLRVIVQHLRRSGRSLETAIAKLSREAQKILAATQELDRRFRLLQSAPGTSRRRLPRMIV